MLSAGKLHKQLHDTKPNIKQSGTMGVSGQEICAKCIIARSTSDCPVTFSLLRNLFAALPADRQSFAISIELEWVEIKCQAHSPARHVASLISQRAAMGWLIE